MRNLLNSLIKEDIDPILMRYLKSSNQLVWVYLLIISCSLGVLFYDQANRSIIFSRIFFGLACLFLYPLFLKLKFYNFSRFYLVLMLPVTTLYLPLITKNFGSEYYIKGPYQPIVGLIFLFWCLHPHRDKIYFWLSVLAIAPFPSFTSFLGNWAKPGSAPLAFQEYQFNMIIAPFIFFIAAFLGAWYIISTREKSLLSLSETNIDLLNSLKENEVIHTHLKTELKNTDEKIHYFLTLNSHEIRLPLSNLKGIYAIFKNEIQQGNIKIPEHLMGHLQNSIAMLDENIEDLNAQLEKTRKEHSKQRPSDE